MSRRSGAAALAVTITVTVAVTVMTIALNPSRGDSYSSQVLENARKRQSYSIAAIPEPLETDLEVLREEDIMAQKVSEILLADSSFSFASCSASSVVKSNDANCSSLSDSKLVVSPSVALITAGAKLPYFA